MDLNLIQSIKARLLAQFNSPEVTNVVGSCNIILCPKMRSTAGKAIYNKNTIKLNIRLLKRHPDHLEQTVAHELAHLISVALYGLEAGRGHGTNWQNVMRRLGFSPDRTHSLDTSGLRRTHEVKGKAKCSCRTFELKARRFNKILNGAKYRCLNCGSHLELLNEVG